jgi:hypothetical protein
VREVGDAEAALPEHAFDDVPVQAVARRQRIGKILVGHLSPRTDAWSAERDASGFLDSRISDALDSSLNPAQGKLVRERPQACQWPADRWDTDREVRRRVAAKRRVSHL